MLEQKIVKADAVIAETLKKKGYKASYVTPNPVADLVIETPAQKLFLYYRREIDMEKAMFLKGVKK